MSPRGRNGLFVAIGIVALLFLGYVWPSVWVYGTNEANMYRVNRFTGTKQWATDFGWLTLEEHGKVLGARRIEQLGTMGQAILKAAKEGKLEYANQNADRLIVRYNNGNVETFYGTDMEPIANALDQAGFRNFTVER